MIDASGGKVRVGARCGEKPHPGPKADPHQLADFPPAAPRRQGRNFFQVGICFACCPCPCMAEPLISWGVTRVCGKRGTLQHSPFPGGDLTSERASNMTVSRHNYPTMTLLECHPLSDMATPYPCLQRTYRGIRPHLVAYQTHDKKKSYRLSSRPQNRKPEI
jgi:hypothetical protein